jgi:hypothetical protein
VTVQQKKFLGEKRRKIAQLIEMEGKERKKEKQYRIY